MNKKQTTNNQQNNQQPQASNFDCLAVTRVNVYPFKEPFLNHIRAFAYVVLNEQFVIRGIKVMDGVHGLFVSYPVDPFYKGDDFMSICNPITRQTREHIENCILEKYQAIISA